MSYKIKGIDNISETEFIAEIRKGAKFVMYTYCISLILLTFKRPSNIYFVRHNEKPIKYGWGFMLISIFLGWWGIPWGPIYTISAIINSFKGIDVTNEVLPKLLVTESQPQSGTNQPLGEEDIQQKFNEIFKDFLKKE